MKERGSANHMTADAESRICRSTGLRLVSAPRAALWRVYRNNHGPTRPPLRSGSPQPTWGRFDVEGFASLYGASDRKGAFIEALAPLKLAEIDFPHFLDGVRSTEDPLAKDWRELGHMNPGSVPAQWRLARSIAAVSVTPESRYIDVTSSETIGVLRRASSQWKDHVDAPQKPLDVSDITGKNRVLTCFIAAWLATQTLDDGSRPNGLRYLSKHGGDLPCWVTWIDLKGIVTADEAQLRMDSEVNVMSNSAIELPDPDLKWAASNLDLTCH